MYDVSSDTFYGLYAVDQWLQLPQYCEFVNEVVTNGAESDMLTVLGLRTVSE